MKSTLPSSPPESAAPRAGSHATVPHDEGIKVLCSCTIRRPPHELYLFWRRLENLPRLARHPLEVTVISETRSRWSVSAPTGDGRVEWDALIINDHPGELIAWRSDDSAEVPNAGSIRFERAPLTEGGGTLVTVALQYDPPGGRVAAWLAKLTGREPTQQVKHALERFKELMEAGEAVPPPGGGTAPAAA